MDEYGYETAQWYYDMMEPMGGFYGEEPNGGKLFVDTVGSAVKADWRAAR